MAIKESLVDVQLNAVSAFAGGGGSLVIKRALITFGDADEESNVSATVADTDVSPSSIIVGGVYYDQTLLTSRSIDELITEPIMVLFEAGTDEVTIHARAMTDNGMARGEYTVWYIIGTSS